MSSSTFADDNEPAALLCAALSEAALPHAEAGHAGVRGRLLSRISEISHHDAAEFFRTQAQLDGIATANCPDERTRVLDELRLKSLVQITRHAG